MCQEMITRRKNYADKKVWFTSNSQNIEGEWFNCLYIHFVKEDFPQLKYPVIVEQKSPYSDNDWTHFDYYNCDLNLDSFHKGITFYEECFYPEKKKTIIKAGCDFQHYMDESYQENDNGKQILTYSDEILEEFLSVANRRLLATKKD
jgi:hypothetical protein